VPLWQPTSIIFECLCILCSFSTLTLLFGRQERHPACKNTVVGCWRGCLSGARCRYHCHSLSLASVESRLVLPFWYRLTWVVPEKGPLNRCVCVLVLYCVCFVANEYSQSVSQSVFKRPKKVDMKLSDVHEFQLFAVQQSFAAVYGNTLYATPLFFGLLGRTACMHPSHASRRCGLLLYTLIFSASGTRPQSGDMN